MASNAELTFHIIYTPGTFFYLRPFLFSLLEWSDCFFRLVTNGCAKEEREMVEAACRANRRLECRHLSPSGMAAKGSVLNLLQQAEKSRYFCCLDSDIFAVGPFMNRFTDGPGRHAAIFSAPHFLMTEKAKTMPAACPGAYGIHVNDPAGRCIGTTCFAIYDNQVLDRYIRGRGIDFSGTAWAQVPQGYRAAFSERGLRVKEYDSGKILNICLSCDGASLLYRNAAELRHIGGFSFASRERPKKATRAIPRDQRADFFHELMGNLFSGRPLPPIPDCSPGNLAKYQSIIAEIASLFEDFRSAL